MEVMSRYKTQNISIPMTLAWLSQLGGVVLAPSIRKVPYAITVDDMWALYKNVVEYMIPSEYSIMIDDNWARTKT